MMHRPHRTHRRGVAAVEFALLAPLLIYLLLGLWEVGRMIEINQILSNAAREGARQASTGLNTNAQVQTVVTNYLQAAGLPTANANVTVSDQTSGADVSQAAQLDQIQVTVSIPFTDVRWIALSLIATPTTTLSGNAYWNCLKDQDYPNTVTAPPGF
jgi:Flp pilus assembly protein TadG